MILCYQKSQSEKVEGRRKRKWKAVHLTETKMILMKRKATLTMKILTKMKNIKYFSIYMKNTKKILKISQKIKDKF